MNNPRRWHLRILNIRSEEAQVAGYFFLHHFFLGIGLSLISMTATTSFLANYPAHFLSVVFGISSVALMLAGRGYAMLEHHLKIDKFLPLISLILIFLVVMLRWMAFKIPGNPTPFVLLVAFQVIYLLSNLKFWGLSAMVFDVRQSKRLFSFISSGDVPAKLLGYLSVSVLVPVIGLHNLLILAALAFVASHFMLQQILREVNLPTAGHHHHAIEKVVLPTSNKKVLMTFFGNELVLSLSLLAFLFTIAFTLIDYTFLSDVQEKYHSEEQLASFLGYFFAIGYALTTVTKLLFTGRIAEYLGVTRTLLSLPLILVVFISYYLMTGSSDLTQFKNIAFVGLLYMGTSVVRYAIYDPMYLVMFQPLSSMLRLKGHTVIKGLIQPLALGLTGLIIYLVTSNTDGWPFYEAAKLLMILAIVWGLAIFGCRYYYRETLRKVLEKRFIAGADLPVTDAQFFELFETKLKNAPAEETLYAISLLQKHAPERLKENCEMLLNHEFPVVIERSLQMLVETGNSDYNSQILQLINGRREASVRCSAIIAYCKLEEKCSEHLAHLFETKETEIYIALLSGLLASQDELGRIRAEEAVIRLLTSGDDEQCLIGLTAMTGNGHPGFVKPLLSLLETSHEGVRLAAVKASGFLLDDQLIVPLISLLRYRNCRREAVLALGQFGTPAVQRLRELYRKGQLDSMELLHAVRVCERVNNPDALKFLLSVATHENIHHRLPALNAMSAMQVELDAHDKHQLHELVEEELVMACSLLVAQEAAQESPTLAASLIFEFDNCNRRIFSVLGLLYDSQLIARAASAIRQAKKEQKANALEVLENSIPRKLHERLVLLHENLSVGSKINRLRKFMPDQGPFEPIAALLMEGTLRYSPWTIACALRSIDKQNLNYRLCVHYIGHKEPLLADIAYAMVLDYQQQPPVSPLPELMQLQLPMKQEHAERLGTLEKVFILKQTRLFADTPENIIAEIVPIVREVNAVEQERIFTKGDSGSSMFIIYDGKIRIHDGDKTFAEMTKGDFFGELALLDPEPRSASATAMTDTLLLKLDEEDAYDLMEERVEVLRGILQILCRRIRNQNRKMVEG